MKLLQSRTAVHIVELIAFEIVETCIYVSVTFSLHWFLARQALACSFPACVFVTSADRHIHRLFVVGSNLVFQKFCSKWNIFDPYDDPVFDQAIFQLSNVTRCCFSFKIRDKHLLFHQAAALGYENCVSHMTSSSEEENIHQTYLAVCWHPPDLLLRCTRTCNNDDNGWFFAKCPFSCPDTLTLYRRKICCSSILFKTYLSLSNTFLIIKNKKK